MRGVKKTAFVILGFLLGLIMEANRCLPFRIQP